MKLRMFCVLVFWWTVCPAAWGAEAPWEDQLLEMDYHIFSISGINAINGLNLSRDQIIQLKALAKKVELAGAKSPGMNQPLHPGFSGVRETYRELRKTVMQGKEISPDLKARVVQARVKEAQVIRASLSSQPEGGSGLQCSRCHIAPDKFKGMETTVPIENASFLGKKLNAGPEEKTAATAHFFGVLGPRGMATVSQLAPQVDAILSDGQKRIMQDFACCLIPPTELSDPVRAGQAEVSEGSLDLLRKVRKASDSEWTLARPNTINRLKGLYVAKDPGLKPQDVAAIEQKLSDIFDRARKMSDSEFEMNKEALCIELKMKKTYPPPTNRVQSFKAAAFLLMPGAAEVYDALLKRTECR
jgi:hypothetical protein